MGANFGLAIVTNGDFTAYVYDNAATRPSSQITLVKLVTTTTAASDWQVSCGDVGLSWVVCTLLLML